MDAEPHRDWREDLGAAVESGRLRRSAPLIGLTARTAGEVALARLRGRSSDIEVAEFHARVADRYARALGRSKGVLMKAGQMLSCTALMPAVPVELRSTYQSALTRLRDDAPAMAPEATRTTIESELGRSVESVFAEFDWRPLAAASIGQVHAARLRDGREVAVKVQYPGVAEAIAGDLRNGELLTSFLSLIVGGMSSRKISFDLRGAAREVSARIAEELDYRLEAVNQAQFAEHYRGHPFIHVPEVVDELCTGGVLTQELVRGRRWEDALLASQELRDRWGEAIWRFTYGSQKRMGVIHGDPHLGNYMFHDDGAVSFLDFGCVKRFSRDQVEMFDVIVRECLRGDALGIWRACVEAGFWRSTDPVTPQEVLDYWRGDWTMLWAEDRFVLTPESQARRVQRRCSRDGPSGNALRHLKMPPEYTLMGRIELSVESVITQLGAGNRWGAIAPEAVHSAAPVTEMGRREHAFFAAREESV